MSKLQRIRKFLTGLLLLAVVVLLGVWPEIGYDVLIIVLCVGMLAYGIRMLIYYFVMARHMVRGKLILLIGILMVDFGLFALTLSHIPKVYMLLYLFLGHMFYSVIDIMRAMEARKNSSPRWQFKLLFGAFNLLIALFALIGGLVVRSVRVPVYIYAVGLLYTGIERIVDAFRKTDVMFFET
ncbi:MAG: DUF308 domain-containing protein [Clostridia bacterium]|nr:DUF308 domain-containing protein [Clostridia bacterium]